MKHPNRIKNLGKYAIKGVVSPLRGRKFPERHGKNNPLYTHGRTETPEYAVWSSLKNRCLNKEAKRYSLYGGRGIKVCHRWKNSFENFFEDMGERPTRDYPLDRINNNGNYCKENCRWATRKEQMRNTRDNIIYKGECAFDASIRLGGNKRLVDKRVTALGWSLNEAFSTPTRKIK